MNLVHLLQEQVGEQLKDKLPGLLGITRDEAEASIGTLVPTVVGFLGMQASSGEGASALFTGLKSLPDETPEMLESLAGEELVEQGESMLKGIVGDHFDSLKSGLAMATGLGEDQNRRLLGSAAPALLGGLKNHIDTNDVSLDGFSVVMAEQIKWLKTSDESDTLGFLGLAAIDNGFFDRKEFANNDLREKEPGATATMAGAASSLVDDSAEALQRGQAKVTAAGSAVVDLTSDAVTSAASGIRTKGAALAGSGAIAASAATSMGHPDNEDEKSGIRKWLIGFAALFAVLWALATCSSHQSASHVETPDTQTADMAQGESPTVEMTAPVVEAPVVEAPVVEAPVVETPVVETPVITANETATDAVRETNNVVEAGASAIESAATATVSAVKGAADTLGDAATATAASVKRVALPDGSKLELSDGSPVDQILSYLKDDNAAVPKAFILRGLNFETASSRITSASNKIIDDLAATLEAYGRVKINLEGYTDSRGNNAANKRLSQARAASVKQALTAAGISSDRMGAEGFGEARPIADNATQAGQLENRRVEVIVTEK